MDTLIQLLETHNMSNKQIYIKTILSSQRIQYMITQLKCQNEATSPTETVVETFHDEKPLPISPSMYIMTLDSAIDIGPTRNKPLPNIQHPNIHVKRVKV